MENVDARLATLVLSAAYFVQIGVDIVKRIIGDDPRARWLLPAVGLVLSFIIVAAIQAYQGATTFDLQIGAGTLLAGIAAYGLAAGAHAMRRVARLPRGGR